MLKPASLTYKDMPWCPGVPEPPEENMVPIDRRFNHLIILGAQKAGTTWLFDALQEHPWFHGAVHGYRCAPLNGALSVNAMQASHSKFLSYSS